MLLTLLLSYTTISASLSISDKQNAPVQFHKAASVYNNNVCKTEKCKKIAKYFRTSINPNVDPCDDFYEYACGMWSRLNPIPDDKNGISTFRQAILNVNKELKDALNNLDPDKYEQKSVKLLLLTYQKCMDENAIERAGAVPLKRQIDEVFGVLPNDLGHTLQSRAEATSGDELLESLAARLWLRHSVAVLVSAYVDADTNDASINIFNIDQAPLGMGSHSEDYYLKEGEPYHSVRDTYLTLMINVSSVLWNEDLSSEPTVQQIHDAEEVFNFEIELAKLNKPAKDRRDVTKMDNKINYNELKHLSRNFDLTAYLRYFKPMEQVNIVEPEYIEKLNDLLERTKPSVVKGHMLWMLILNALPYLSKDLSDYYYVFRKIYAGNHRSEDRAEFCVEIVKGRIGHHRENLGYALGRLYIDAKNFTRHARHHVRRMVDELHTAFRVLLDENDWMDKDTKLLANMKIDKMITNIGYPDFVEDDLDSAYLPLLEETDAFVGTKIFPKDDFYDIMRKLGTWQRQKQNHEINEPYDHHTFAGSPAIVNAWFYSTKNSITFPAGILQSPFYDPDFPMAVNFGSIGSVIGHEITHGFDDIGSQFDGDGNLVNWWSEKSREQFKQKAQCMIDQYSEFCYPHLGDNVCVRGIETQGENIADNGGIIQGFLAYKSYMKGKPDLVLPSFEDFSPEQIFFISNANFECANDRDQALLNRINTNEHAPGRDRIIGVVQNFDEFAKAFNCPVGSRMNPKRKCIVW